MMTKLDSFFCSEAEEDLLRKVRGFSLGEAKSSCRFEAERLDFQKIFKTLDDLESELSGNSL